jgi:glycosyltransferase involved in cell wall biosynthesis
MRTRILVGEGRFQPDPDWYREQRQPCPEFVFLAHTMQGSIASFTTAAAQRGRWFRYLFRHWPLLGSAIGAVLDSNRFEILYCVSEDLGMFAAPLLRLRRWRGQLITVVHGIGANKRLWFRIFGHKGMAALITNSEPQVQTLIRECGIPAEKVHYFPYWLDTDFFTPSPPSEVHNGRFVFACGRENRDYATLLAAARQLDVPFTILAHGYFGDHVNGSDDVPSNVAFRPRVPYSELISLYRAAQLIVVPLNDVSYAAGLTGMLEAMASGKCVVVTKSHGLRSYLDARNPGAIVPPRDPGAMARAVADLLQSPERMREIGARNREWVERHAALPVYAQHVANVVKTFPVIRKGADPVVSEVV